MPNKSTLDLRHEQGPSERSGVCSLPLIKDRQNIFVFIDCSAAEESYKAVSNVSLSPQYTENIFMDIHCQISCFP